MDTHILAQGPYLPVQSPQERENGHAHGHESDRVRGHSHVDLLQPQLQGVHDSISDRAATGKLSAASGGDPNPQA